MCVCDLCFNCSTKQRTTFIPQDGPLDVSPLDMQDDRDDVDLAIDHVIEKEQQWNYHVKRQQRHAAAADDEEEMDERAAVEDIEHDYSPEKQASSISSMSMRYHSKAPTPSKQLLEMDSNYRSQEVLPYYSGHDAREREPLHSARSQVGERTKQMRTLYGSPESKQRIGTAAGSGGSRKAPGSASLGMGTRSRSFHGRGGGGDRERGRRSQSATRNRSGGGSTEHHFDRGVPSWISR